MSGGLLAWALLPFNQSFAVLTSWFTVTAYTWKEKTHQCHAVGLVVSVPRQTEAQPGKGVFLPVPTYSPPRTSLHKSYPFLDRKTRRVPSSAQGKPNPLRRCDKAGGRCFIVLSSLRRPMLCRGRAALPLCWGSKGPQRRDWSCTRLCTTGASALACRPCARLPTASCMHGMGTPAPARLGRFHGSLLRHNQDFSTRFQREDILF